MLKFFKVDGEISAFNPKYFKGLPAPCKYPVYKMPEGGLLEYEEKPDNGLLVTPDRLKEQWYWNEGWSDKPVPKGKVINGIGGFKDAPVELDEINEKNIDV